MDFAIDLVAGELTAKAKRNAPDSYNASAKAPRYKVDYFQPEQITEILDRLEGEPIQWRAISPDSIGS